MLITSIAIWVKFIFLKSSVIVNYVLLNWIIELISLAAFNRKKLFFSFIIEMLDENWLKYFSTHEVNPNS